MARRPTNAQNSMDGMELAAAVPETDDARARISESGTVASNQVAGADRPRAPAVEVRGFCISRMGSKGVSLKILGVNLDPRMSWPHESPPSKYPPVLLLLLRILNQALFPRLAEHYDATLKMSNLHVIKATEMIVPEPTDASSLGFHSRNIPLLEDWRGLHEPVAA